MTRHDDATEKKDWYSVSVETVRALGVLVLIAVLAALIFLGYRAWEHYSLRQEAARLIEEARVLHRDLQGREGLESFRSEYTAAWESLQQAEGHYAMTAFAEAANEARRSRALLLSILDVIEQRGPGGEAQFISVEGSVEFRRGNRGDWREARSRTVLRSGDFVKTGANSSAEIMFLDGALYTVRPNTLFQMTRSRTGVGVPAEQFIDMEYGWVDLSTAQQRSRVATPRAEARVERETEAMVAFDEATDTGRFAAFRGTVDIASRAGERRRIGALQQVLQTGDELSQPQDLPPAPVLVEPPERFEVDRESGPTLALVWDEVDRAAGYSLQVSRSRLFVDNIIDAPYRTRSSATLGLRGDGSFTWRVAAVSEQGLQGPWSAPASFRVVSARGNDGGAMEGPRLEIEEVQAYGSLFVVSGSTEPGATLAINDEPVDVASDGSFTKTIQMPQEGWAFIEVRASGPQGPASVFRQRVFVESL